MPVKTLVLMLAAVMAAAALSVVIIAQVAPSDGTRSGLSLVLPLAVIVALAIRSLTRKPPKDQSD